MGYPKSRWTLELLKQACDWLTLDTTGGMSSLLKRLGISYKRGRDYVHSPDRHYMEKLSQIELAKLRAYYDPKQFVMIYVDQFTFYRQPSLSQSYEATGHLQPLAHRSHRSNTCYRIMAGLNAITGQVTARQRSRISRFVIADFWLQLREDYPNAKQIDAVIDNWPVHYHPDALAPLQQQHFPFPPYVPPHWPTAPSAKAKIDTLPIRLLPLPTYASWLNPIEKLWKWLNQDVLHLHRLSHDWDALKQLVSDFLDQFQSASDELLRYTGLLPDYLS